MDEYDGLDMYSGDAVHDSYVDYDRHMNTNDRRINSNDPAYNKARALLDELLDELYGELYGD